MPMFVNNNERTEKGEMHFHVDGVRSVLLAEKLSRDL